jgi:adenylate kinase family enzyme
MRVLLTGMSGAGKSTLVRELRRRGFEAYDADDDGFSGPASDGRWDWKVDEVEPRLRRSADLVLATTAPPDELADAVLAHIDCGDG